MLLALFRLFASLPLPVAHAVGRLSLIHILTLPTKRIV